MCLEPRVMDVLVYVAERSGDVLTKEQLAERVWLAQHVGDDVVTATMREDQRDDVSARI